MMTGLVSILVIRMRRNTAVNRGDTERERASEEQPRERAKEQASLRGAGYTDALRCSHATDAATQRHRTTITTTTGSSTKRQSQFLVFGRSGWKGLAETVKTAAFIAHSGHVTVEKAYFIPFVGHTLTVGALLGRFTDFTKQEQH